MPMRIYNMLLCVAPSLLGGACISQTEIRNNYEDAKIGQVILLGYLRSGTELSLYENSEDAKNSRARKCINGIVSTTSLDNIILYDHKFVKIVGVVKNYSLPAGDIEAMHVRIKNTCHSSKIFEATEIQIAN